MGSPPTGSRARELSIGLSERAEAPSRTCVGCGAVRNKDDLFRLTRGPRSDRREVSIDRSGRAPGRGAYICPSLACFDAAVAKRRFNRAFRAGVEMDLERLRVEIAKNDR